MRQREERHDQRGRRSRKTVFYFSAELNKLCSLSSKFCPMFFHFNSVCCSKIPSSFFLSYFSSITFKLSHFHLPLPFTSTSSWQVITHFIYFNSFARSMSIPSLSLHCWFIISVWTENKEMKLLSWWITTGTGSERESLLCKRSVWLALSLSARLSAPVYFCLCQWSCPESTFPQIMQSDSPGLAYYYYSWAHATLRWFKDYELCYVFLCLSPSPNTCPWLHSYI